MTEKYYLLGLSPPLSVSAALQEYQERLYADNRNFLSLCFSPLIPLFFTSDPLVPPKAEFRLCSPLMLMQPFEHQGNLYLKLTDCEVITKLIQEISAVYSKKETPPTKHKAQQSDLFACIPSIFISPLYASNNTPFTSAPGDTISMYANTVIPEFLPAKNIQNFSSLTLCFLEYRIGNNEFSETIHWETKIRKPLKSHV